jgi:nucleoside-diphosphate-sugar epimerase
MKSKILITGGAGYIGSELISRLIHDNEIYVIDSMLYDKTSLLRYVGHPNFNFEKADIRDKSIYSKYLKKCDIIIPLAALVGFPLCEERKQEAIDVNYKSNKWLCDNKSKDQMVIYPCTNSGYGTSINGKVLTEEDPLKPITLYGKTKVDAENIFRNTDNCTTFRLATVFGPSTRVRTDLLVNNFVLKALRDRVLVLYECEFMRNYIHIWDICKAFTDAIDSWNDFKNETFNVGNDQINMNKLQLAETISKYTPLEIIKAEFTKDPDKRDYVVSSQKIYDRGFSCSYNLDVGIKQMIELYNLIEEPWYANY